VSISILPTKAVITGAPAVPYLTPVKVAVVAVPAAGCFNNNINDFPAEAAGIVNVQAVALVSVAVRTVPAVITRVNAEVTVPIATTVSMYPLIVGVFNTGLLIVGVPASVYVPVADPLSMGAVIVGVPARVYVPVAEPLKTGAVIVLFVRV
jgi:hypothetical protein